MLRMEIALFLVVAFVAYIYFSTEKEQAALHKAFSGLLVCVLAHLALDGITVYFDWEAHDCEVVGEAADSMEALAKIDSLRPDIAIMDINIPIMNGLKVIQMSRLKHPDTAFVIVSGYADYRVFTKVFKKSEGVTPSQYRRDFLEHES